MSSRIHSRLLPVLLLVLAACAPPKVWERVEVASQRTPDGSFSVDLPIGRAAYDAFLRAKRKTSRGIRTDVTVVHQTDPQHKK